jgi:choline dehydrogenase-like flavoprotein
VYIEWVVVLLYGVVKSYRWSDTDFEANAKDGHGIDWPIRYNDLAPWYDHVEKFAGISGSLGRLATIALMENLCLQYH